MGVLVRDTFYLAGHIAADPATKKVPSDIESEVRILMGSIRDTLGKAGLSMQDLVYVQVFLSGRRAFRQVQCDLSHIFPGTPAGTRVHWVGATAFRRAL